MDEPVRWVTKAEAAQELEVSLSTLDRMEGCRDNNPAQHCKQRLSQPLQRRACGLAPGVAGDHVAVLPSPLVLDRRSRRSGGHHPPGHADAAAVSGEVFAQAGVERRGADPPADLSI